MTTHASPPKNAITESEYRRRVVAAGGPGMICIDTAVIPDPKPPGLIAQIIDLIFPEPRFPCRVPNRADRPVPHTLTSKAEALLTAAEPEAGT